MNNNFTFLKMDVTLVRSVRAVIGISCLIAGLSGCAMLSGAGPRISSITSESNSQNPAYPYSFIDLSPSTIGNYIRQPEPPPLEQVALPNVPEIHLVPGDVIRVLISDDSGAEKTIFAPLALGGTIFEKVRVDSAGSISLPYVGTKLVAGSTLTQVEEIIRRSVHGRVSEPQVHVEIVGDLSGSVLVAGAVKAPGRFSALQGPLTILDAINRAGGPLMEPYLMKVVLRTGKDAYTYNYQDLLSGRNITVPPGSEIVLERDRKRFVAMGAVSKQGLLDFPSSNPSLLEVLGSVGGLNERSADPTGVFVFRLAPTEHGAPPQPTVFRLDMREPVSMFLAKNFLILPDDTIYVTNAPVYEMQKIIAPIVQVLVLGRTLESNF